jgi:hypothetical protein
MGKEEERILEELYRKAASEEMEASFRISWPGGWCTWSSVTRWQRRPGRQAAATPTRRHLGLRPLYCSVVSSCISTFELARLVIVVELLHAFGGELATEATYASVAHLEDKSKTVDESIVGIKQRIF